MSQANQSHLQAVQSNLGIRQLAANDMMQQLTKCPRYQPVAPSNAMAQKIHNYQMLDDDYGGLLIDEQSTNSFLKDSMT